MRIIWLKKMTVKRTTKGRVMIVMTMMMMMMGVGHCQDVAKTDEQEHSLRKDPQCVAIGDDEPATYHANQ